MAANGSAVAGPERHTTPTEASSASSDTPPAPKAKTTCVSVSITTKDQLLLAGSYWAPKSKDKAPAALLIHGAGSDRTSLDELGEYLVKKGFAVMSLDVRGHGGSVCEAADWSKATDDKARENLWGLAARDVDAAAEYLLQRSEVHSTNLSVFGIGSGCALALRHAQSDDNTRALVLITPEAESFGYNLGQGLVKLGGLPTLLMASNKAKDVVEGMKALVDEANHGQETIEISLVRAEPAAVLSDSKLNNSAATWLRTQVMPKK
ncbi:MAG: alpha/beta fold hydrolase [Planctomycetota bacterium]